MSLEQFLDRMVAPGNYLAVAFKARQGIAHQFFPRNNIVDAAKLIHWASDTINTDVWYALASYNTATPETTKAGRQIYRGSRTQANAQALKCFWFDADIKRAGDGKDPTKVFKDRAELVRWVKDFSAATGILLPNVWVNSGYGVHLYWTLATALPRDQWQPHADALKAALIAHGAKGDTSVVADSARILRPVGTFNYKDPANPAPCHAILDQPDGSDAALLAALGTTRSAAGLTGAPSKVAQRAATSLAANAMAGISAQPRDFQQIANSCAQVGTSLTEHGEHDGRQLWRAMLTLAFFCEDTDDWSHEVGNLHPTYDQVKTDIEIARIAAEHAKKSFGAPLCASFDAERSGVCAACPHNGNVTTPYQLGLKTAAPVASPNTLPSGFRRNNGWLEHLKKDKKENLVWRRVVEGDVRDPIVDLVDRRTRLTFTYRRLVSTRVSVYHDELYNAQAAYPIFSQGGVYLGYYNARGFLDLLMAWIEQLTRYHPAEKQLPSFGWATANGTYAGIGVGGTYYDPTGQEIEAPSGDRKLAERYAPQGTLAAWQKAATFVIGNVPELHTAVAVSFGAPLMALAGEAGGCIAFVGPSGVGKSSAFNAGAAVWGDPLRTMLSLDDTSNAQSHMLGQTRVMPIYWDEAKVATRERQAEMVTTLHKLTQGRDKARLTSAVQLREGGEWNTLFPIATNNSVADLVAAQDGHKGATSVRLVQVEVPARVVPVTTQAAPIIASLRLNYGHAGRQYAKYIAQHVRGIEGDIIKVKQAILDATAPNFHEERFQVAIAGCIIEGAILANRIGLIQFDVKGIAKLLCAAILREREAREALEPQDLHDSLAQIVHNFVHEYMDSRFISSRFAAPGPKRTGNEKLPEFVFPHRLPTPAYHLAVTERVLRIDRYHFRDWCVKNQMPYSQLLQQMKKEWGAKYGKNDRGSLGAGTDYKSLRPYVVDVPLTNNWDLQWLLDAYKQFDETTGSAAPVKKVVPLRPSGTVSRSTQTPPP